MARSFLLFLVAACCCCLALLPSPVQGRPGAGRDHRLLFPEQHFDVAEPTEQQGGVAVKKATPSWSSPPPPAEAGGVVTPELRLVPGGSNPLHNYGGTATRQDEERTPVAPPAPEGNAVRPELRTTPWGANPLHN